MSYRLKNFSNKNRKQEQELHICTNPFANSRLALLNNDDYQAPLTARTLSSNSKWIIVRNNIHKIRSWGGINTKNVNDPFHDWYVYFQMRRELRRTQEQIQEISNSHNFVPVNYFYLPINEKRRQRYNVSHIKPSDVLYYSSVGQEPIVLQSLLYYFSKECAVPYNSIFRGFLSDICSIIERDRQRINRAAVFRKVALTIAIVVFVILGLMLFVLVLSVLKTTSEFRNMYRNDPNRAMEWQQSDTT